MGMGNILIQQPQPYDLVGDPIRVAGLSVAFEATVQWELSEGHDMLGGFFTGGGGSAVRQFQTTITGVAGTAMKQPLMFLTLFTLSAADGSRQDETTVPLIYGPATPCLRLRSLTMVMRRGGPRSRRRTSISCPTRI
jgi:hypothetical protein